MTRKQRDVIERARKTPARFITAAPSRVCRSTAYEYHARERMRLMEANVTKLLEAEQQRLVRTWRY